MRGDAGKAIFPHNQTPAVMQGTARNWVSRKKKRSAHIPLGHLMTKDPVAVF